MIQLLVNSKVTASVSDTSFGGVPVKNANQAFEWPLCQTCDLPMQFLGKIATDIGMHNIFMCQNDPGGCGEWDCDSGANRVIINQNQMLERVTEIPETGEALRDTHYGGCILSVDKTSYHDAHGDWPYDDSYQSRDILGQLYGEPSWLQGDETPNCDTCQKPMRFVAQLEQGPGWETEMNFAGGCAYLFDCADCIKGKFLWQC